MTAVASPPSISHLPRPTWSNSNGTHSSMNSESETSRMILPRKSAQRTNSSTSISSTSSTTSTSSIASTNSTQTTVINGGGGGGGVGSGSDSGWVTKKKPARGLWPSSSKAEPVAGLSTARPQSVAAASSGPSAATAISALHNPAPLIGLPSQQTSLALQQQQQAPQPMSQPQSQLNGISRIPQTQSESSAAILHLLPINGTFERKAITLPFGPDVLRIGRQTNQKTLPTQSNGYFDSKVLSRQHAEIWADRDGKIWIKDVKSSNGTFINGKRLSLENRDSEPHQLKEQDVLELGIDIISEDQKTVVHHKVAARVEHAGIYGNISSSLELNFGELDPAAPGGHLHGPGMGLRGRLGSNSSTMSNGRFGVNAASGMQAAAFHAKWLQPITMEQVVKRLNNELRQARLQTQDLQHTGNLVDAVLVSEKMHVPTGGKVSSPSKPFDSTRPRFTSEPPAPPPTQPLPEAPSKEQLGGKVVDMAILKPLLQRSESEKSRILSPTTSPSKDPSHQILSLIEALTSAQNELTSKSEKLKDMETELAKEREERKSVEEKIVQLETVALAAAPPEDEEKEVLAPPDFSSLPDVTELQQRVENMRTEMETMRSQMEVYRQRAQTAEAESVKDRQSLAEMVEKFQKREEAAKQRREKRRQSQNTGDGDHLRKHHDGQGSGNVDAEISLSDEDDEPELDVSQIDEQHLEKIVKANTAIQNGSLKNPMSPAELQELGKAVLDNISSQKQQQSSSIGVMTGQRTTRQEQLVQTAPYASLIGVVLLGVGMMAYLNGWQKITER